ncbi:MAG: hypothetical protein EOO02_15575, partial [Chitinophagaceae bacterium]
MKTFKDQFMKKLLTLLLMFCGFTAVAQQYNNEWIRFDQTYYKFKVGSAGLYRIPKSVLDNAGIGATGVEYFELWNNGRKIPFYASVANGALPSNGYLEFWASTNDGSVDKGLYRIPAYQHSDKISLLTDTAAYFLSVNTTGSGAKFTTITNDPDASVLPVESSFMYTTGYYFREQINPGFAAVVGEYVYSSSYDKGEFWSTRDIYPSSPLLSTLTGLQVNSGVPTSYLKFGAAGNALNSRTLRISLNSTVIKDTVMDFFNDITSTVAIPTSLIAGGTAN